MHKVVRFTTTPFSSEKLGLELGSWTAWTIPLYQILMPYIRLHIPNNILQLQTTKKSYVKDPSKL